MKKWISTTAVLVLLFGTALMAADAVQEIDWDTLIPEDYRAEKIFEQFGNIDELEDDDPRTEELMKALEKAWSEAPIVQTLEGKKVKLPGFVVPLESDGKKVSEFLLVPYYGACIHVPPPPANQTVLVTVPKGEASIRRAFDTVWVTGTMHTKTFKNDLATAGYHLEAEDVTPYE
ncbi:MAG: DUF3299 domain-containing protein [Chromatiales bacterium]|jgi:hypothetical protein